MRHQFEKGQTLIEVIVALALGVIIIVALVNLTTRSTRNANSSKIAEIASKFAQEGQEALRQIKTNNGTIKNGPGGVTAWSDLYSVSGVFGTLNPLQLVLVKPNGAYNGGCASSWCLDGNTGAAAEDGSTKAADTGGVTISRLVKVYDAAGAPGVNSCFLTSATSFAGYSAPPTLDATLVKSVQVVVTWTDQTGTHTNTLESCITRRT